MAKKREKARSPRPSTISYLNTDLDLVAAHDFALLTNALSERGVDPLGGVQEGDDGQWYAVLETRDYPQPNEPEVTIRVMLDAIEAIDGPAKTLWAACSKREFNIGYDCGDEPWAFNNGLSHATLSRIATLGASLRITLYPQTSAATK